MSKHPQPTVEELLKLIDEMRDPDPCWYDHHGHCQAHGWPYTEPRCPMARAAELFDNEDPPTA